jgi:hypothetical protein
VIDRLKDGWFTPAVVALLLVGASALDSRAMAVVAGLLLVAGLVFTPRQERLRGGATAALGAVVALGIAVAIRLWG